MTPIYISEMFALKESDPELWQELTTENWVVNKSPQVSSCALGADHALELVNRWMKVAGITQNRLQGQGFFFGSTRVGKT